MLGSRRDIMPADSPAMKDASVDLSRVKAIVFDMDGTLYRQGPLRRAMALRLVFAHLVRPVHGYRTFRVLSAYRKAQEHMRDGTISENLAEAQIRLASERTQVEPSFVLECVTRWMEQEPLALLPSCAWPG